MHEACQDILEKALSQLNIPYEPAQIQALQTYVDGLLKWNHAINLVATFDRTEIIVKHLIDSLSILPYLVGERVLDLGTGAGLPGIPLAILSPERQFILVDSRSKKTQFLNHIVSALSLKHVSVMTERVEDLVLEEVVDCITARAVASSEQLIQWSAPLLRETGCYLLMQGKDPSLLSNEMQQTWKTQSYALKVPYLEASRTVLKVERKREDEKRG